MTTEQRHRDWLAVVLGGERPVERIEWLAGDASLRRYARVHAPGGTTILVDMQRADEDMDAVLRIGSRLREEGISAPLTKAYDSEWRLILQEDFGDASLNAAAAGPDCARLYRQALQTLVQLQQAHLHLPAYDRALLLQEISLFPEWFVGGLLGETPPGGLLDAAFSLILDTVLEQPQVVVHRDYHSRNLMVLEDGRIGVLDFQDAVIGPVTYDLASLLRDVYCDWPEAQRTDWLRQYRELAGAAGIAGADSPDLPRWLDFTALQRLLKILGIFCRLERRDGKPAYLPLLPLTLASAVETCTAWPELQDLRAYLAGLAAPLRNALRDAPGSAAR